MKYRWLLAALIGLVAARHASSSTVQQLASFNHSAPWEGVSAEELDKPLLAHFRNYSFVCRQVKNFTPEESPDAVAAFASFAGYLSKGDRTDQFWGDPAHAKRREQLLADAIKAGSWRASYFDSMWSIRMKESDQSLRQANEQMQRLTRQGIPLVAYRYATLMYGRDDETMYQLLIAAIERGSPDAMTLVGGSIVVRSKELRPLAKRMLDCALSQGHTEAYESLGILADMQGHGVDAYRLWQQGANQGCAACATRFEDLAKLAPDYRLTRPLAESMPELARLEQFYAGNFWYEVTALPDFKRRPPPELAVHVDDTQLLAWLKLRAASAAP